MKKPRKIKILLTAGGTGGHFYPLVAVAKELARQIAKADREADIRFFGDPGNYRQDLLTAGIRITHITPSKWRNYFSLQNFLDIFRFAWSIPQAFFKIFFFMPHVCFTKGGSGTLAVIYACRFYFIPMVVHESDSVPGKANAIAARGARGVTLAFASAADYFKKLKTQPAVVGNPIRAEIVALQPKTDEERRVYKMEWGFDPNLPLLFIFGGSQGAGRLNAFVLEHIEALAEKFQILHQTGIKNFDAYQKEFAFISQGKADISSRYRFLPYLNTEQIAKAYGAADLLVGRGGASTIFEAAATGTPSILIPIPEAAQNHQFQNAYAYHAAGGAIMLEEGNLLISVFLSEALKLIGDPARINAMRSAARAFFIPGSEGLIAEQILSALLPKSAASAQGSA